MKQCTSGWESISPHLGVDDQFFLSYSPQQMFISGHIHYQKKNKKKSMTDPAHKT